ncbi:MAG: hydroxymethylbilane synthase [Rhodospirillaceae bacterium]|jgi:hydroxymethylbilane synthase|nr:hydroxymethylbilane synthase [Rhodospirillaceae bacterium]MBT5080997.1 hydroxymethylbilane synthase [Rhodospirillaceae bacterium]MBT5527335.1 hydroxymethylbilane synthase [Rhodospirillaceae bacterium]MBT5878343.1 hydroxymethylbilane synthase [Rhodospirillaceae bacterium]MBT6590921.1 hydroxymethylbilane synthase [Rhodospirillaceae bacterium]
MNLQDNIRIGTRGSPLALAQAEEVKSCLLAAHTALTANAVEIVVIATTGDQIQSKPLKEFGGKGLFTKEIEEALLVGDIHMAVHSMKDVPTELPAGLGIVCLLPREDPRDGFLSPIAKSLADLPQGAVVGSSSLRRVAQVRHVRPDLQVVNFRGNVNTRMRKLSEGVAQATFLACAGLNRLGMSERITAPVPVDVMLPAVAQAVIGVETRLDDDATIALLQPLHHLETDYCVAAERALLAALDGSCRTPIAALAELQGDRLTLRAQILREDGSESLETQREGPVVDVAEAAAMGRDAGEELRGRAGPDFFTSV